MYIRLSKEDDKGKIQELVDICFGPRPNGGILDNLQGRYLLAFDSNEENELLAMTGLDHDTVYNRYEIDWTCTTPMKRCGGIMHELFKRICNLTDEPIYSVCWRIHPNDRCNLYSLMDDFGFKEVIHAINKYDSEYQCSVADSCKGRVDVDGKCICYQDLYLRDKVIS